eukprot:6606833-Alexandrium_andersonii.AAC.1
MGCRNTREQDDVPLSSLQQKLHDYARERSFEEKKLFLDDQVELVLQATTIDEPHGLVSGDP